MTMFLQGSELRDGPSRIAASGAARKRSPSTAICCWPATSRSTRTSVRLTSTPASLGSVPPSNRICIASPRRRKPSSGVFFMLFNSPVFL